MSRNRRIKQISLQDAKLYDQITQMEALILSKLGSIRRSSRNYDCYHIEELKPFPELYDSTCNYYDKFWKLYLTIQFWREKVKLSQQDVTQCETKIEGVENNFRKLESLKLQNHLSKSKHRRRYSDIEKKHECPYQNCFRLYGTQPALRLHVKQKHKEKS